MPKSIRKFVTFQAVPKIEKISPRCDLEPISDQRPELWWWTFASQGPQGTAPRTRTRQKNEGERQKERRTKKERVRKVEKGTKGFEHASGQRPGEFFPKFIFYILGKKENVANFKLFTFFIFHFFYFSLFLQILHSCSTGHDFRASYPWHENRG